MSAPAPTTTATANPTPSQTGQDQVNSGEDSNSQSDHDPRLDIWKPEHNVILSEWADKAMCYRWLHFRSYMKYHRQSMLFTIPVIIISTLTGTANFATDKLKWTYTSSVIGAFNIIAGIASTIQQFMKVNELSESHKFASLSWDKFYRNIKVELSKNPLDRISAYHMLKLYKEEYDRLMETCPVVNDDIINMFLKTFKKSETFENVQKPEICDELVPTLSAVYKEPPRDEIINVEPAPQDPDRERAEAMVARFRQQNLKSLQDRKILENFMVDFKKINNRNPGEDEVINNLKNKVDVDILRKMYSGM
jgi:hypothetical protein